MQTTPSSKSYGDILIYGANGYTADLIIELARSEGAKPVLAGRAPEKLRSLANRHALETKVFPLENPTVIAKNLAGISVVLNCAGPFARTAEPLARACMKAGTHYLDITGEFGVFEALASLNTKAQTSGVMLMPGVGFDVVPSDCLAAHMKRRMPDATSLTMAFQAIGQPSHGTATTMVENVGKGDVCEGVASWLRCKPLRPCEMWTLAMGPYARCAFPGATFQLRGIPHRYRTSKYSWLRRCSCA
jgi:short subunit dehydrogenase-like uncharacterized protein